MNPGCKEWGQYCAHCTSLKNSLRRPEGHVHVRDPPNLPSPVAMGKRRRRQMKDVTGSRSLNPACRRFRILVAWLLTRRRQHHSAAPWTTKQPFLGRALLAPHGEGPRKVGLTKVRLHLPSWLTAVNGHLSLRSKNNENKKVLIHL